MIVQSSFCEDDALGGHEVKLLKSISILLRVFTIDESRFPAAEGRMRYNPLDFQTLRYLAERPGAKAADVARFLGVAATTQQAVMDRLVKAGHVSRTDHPQSRRAKAHALTEAGQALFDAILRQDLANMATMLSCLTPEEQSQIVALTEKVAQALEKPPHY